MKLSHIKTHLYATISFASILFLQNLTANAQENICSITASGFDLNRQFNTYINDEAFGSFRSLTEALESIDTSNCSFTTSQCRIQNTYIAPSVSLNQLIVQNQPGFDYKFTKLNEIEINLLNQTGFCKFETSSNECLIYQRRFELNGKKPKTNENRVMIYNRESHSRVLESTYYYSSYRPESRYFLDQLKAVQSLSNSELCYFESHDCKYSKHPTLNTYLISLGNSFGYIDPEKDMTKQQRSELIIGQFFHEITDELISEITGYDCVLDDSIREYPLRHRFSNYLNIDSIYEIDIRYGKNWEGED